MCSCLQRGTRAAAAVIVAAVLAGCGAAPTSLTELNTSYELALERTAPLAVTLDSEAERLAFDRLQQYFTAMSAESVRDLTATVYAPGAYLNDTLVGIDGNERIQAYFAHTMENADQLKVEFLDRAPTGADWFARWRMTVVASGLDAGRPVVTYGVSQLRFDAEGRVLLHKDFWDSGTGLYEQLPVVGWIVSRVRAVIESGET